MGLLHGAQGRRPEQTFLGDEGGTEGAGPGQWTLTSIHRSERSIRRDEYPGPHQDPRITAADCLAEPARTLVCWSPRQRLGHCAETAPGPVTTTASEWNYRVSEWPD